MVVEKEYRAISGWLIAAILASLVVLAIYCLQFAAKSLTPPTVYVVAGILSAIVAFVLLFGFLPVNPNEAVVLILFGRYQGTIKDNGLLWINPLLTKREISLRIRNFETGHQTSSEMARRTTKVNDRDGNPIEVSAVVVWKVVNTAEAFFEVDDYEDYVQLQSESALRNLASHFPYDSSDEELSLRRSTDEISDRLKSEIEARLHKAGVEVLEARLNHLAYAPEIAGAMLQRQQASAVVAARTKIVEGAVGMVELALDHLSEKKLVDLTPESRAQLVSNLLVVLCADRHVQPVVNTGPS
ncbi:SPFH domain-containing protein [bacterium]|nr:SPFH domain-containing protein [bacterium]